MHGVKREYDVSSEELKQRSLEQECQLAKWNESLAATSNLTADSSFEDIMEKTAAVLLQNPDHYHVWNMRKRAIIKHSHQVDLKAELGFSVETIKVGPKSYYAWFHRRWLLSRLCPAGAPFDPSHELHLCQILLDLDKRNFHCWNYRKWLAEHFKIPIQDEFDYTGRKIFQNFSNYSAWHRRAMLMPACFSGSDLVQIINADLNLVKNAYFTEPADQSPWMYLELIMQLCRQVMPNEWEQMVQTEISNINELLSIEPDAPLALMSQLRLKSLIGRTENNEESVDRLSAIDPQRAGFYRHLLKQQ